MRQFYNTCHIIQLQNDLYRVHLKLEMLERSVDLPGALDAIFTTRNDRGALWVTTIQVNPWVNVKPVWNWRELHNFTWYLNILFEKFEKNNDKKIRYDTDTSIRPW